MYGLVSGVRTATLRWGGRCLVQSPVAGAVLPVHSQSYVLQQLASKLTLRAALNTDQPVLLDGKPY
jgi:hypothetical protein